ncbi:hypothetical protein BX600DRAFT_498142 [Xylariales sp. PMI_506]|nr:hypothetical protein BX600DRAFT_498142 [Xylariales sp. PMI_506]
MAILDTVPGIEIWATVAGNRASLTPVSTKFIESLDNEIFAINFTIGKTYPWGYRNHALSFKVEVDGSYVGGRIVEERTALLKRSMTGSRTLNEKKKQCVEQRFKFSALQSIVGSDLNKIQMDKDDTKNTGLIEVKVKRVIVESRNVKPSQVIIRDSVNLELAEESIKTKQISHRASLVVVLTILKYYDTTPLDDDGRAIAIYRFKHPEAKLLIPRTPSPSPQLSTTDSTPDIYRIVQEVLQRIGHNKIKPKKEEEEEEVKKEKEANFQKRKLGNVIDLTGDDSLPKAKRLCSGKKPRSH